MKIKYLLDLYKAYEEINQENFRSPEIQMKKSGHTYKYLDLGML